MSENINESNNPELVPVEQVQADTKAPETITPDSQETSAPLTATSVIARLAAKSKVDPKKLWATLKTTFFRADQYGNAFSDEEVMLVLMVAEQLGLNPLYREIWAFRGQGGAVCAQVSIDGWKQIMLRQPNFNGYKVTYSDTKVTIDKRELPEWAECTIYVKNIDHPIVERVWLEEVFMGKRPNWTSSPRRMLHHRAMIQAIRFAFPVAGITAPEDDNGKFDYIDGTFSPSSEKSQVTNKELNIDKAKLDEFATKAIAMARLNNDYGPALQCVNSIKHLDSREYVLAVVNAAKDEDLRKAMNQLESNASIASGNANETVVDQLTNVPNVVPASVLPELPTSL